MRGVAANGRRAAVVAFSACALLVPTACGGGEKQDADEKEGSYTVDVTRASFPPEQRLAQKSRMTIAVQNTGNEVVPNVVVTLRGGGGPSSSGSGAGGQGVDAFGYRTKQQGVADPSRPVWIIDAGPDQVQREGPGGGVTAYVNTWALGTLARGQTKTFTWDVTAVRAGRYEIDWRVSAGLDGKAVAKLESGQVPEGSFSVDISGEPAEARVDEDGNVVRETN